MLNQYENEANPSAHVCSTGPEIWHQTEGKVTHFVAGLGTCGTITGGGRYLKGKDSSVKVIGVYPEEGHDIPGVRSLKQLSQTKLFMPDEYDGLVCVSNDEAFEMCLRLNREESLIAGPSSAMALVGALKVIEDQPDAVVVVIFPDNAFRYVSTIQKHFPEFRALGGPATPPQASSKETLFESLVENSRNPHNTIEIDTLAEDMDAGKLPFLLDVRGEEAYVAQHIAGAVNIPIAEISGRLAELPAGLDSPIVTACFRGNMSITGMLLLQSHGYRNVRSLNGGTIGWADQGLPTEAAESSDSGESACELPDG